METVGCPTVLVFYLERVPSKLETTSSVLRQQPSKLNPCRNVCYLYVLTKEQGKETWALPIKKLAKAFDDYLAKEGCWKTLFQNTQELSTPMCPPRNSWTTQRMRQSTKHCQSQLMPTIFILQLWRNIPLTSINNNDLHRVALAQHLLYRSKGEMLRREQSKGHRKGTRAWQKNIQSL